MNPNAAGYGQLEVMHVLAGVSLFPIASDDVTAGTRLSRIQLRNVA